MKRLPFAVTVIVLLAGSFARPAHAGLLLAIDSIFNGPDTLYSVDPTTGAGTAIGEITGMSGTPPNGFTRPSGLTYDETTSTLYTIDLGTGELFTIDPSTAAATLVATTIGVTGWQDLAFDSSEGQLYGIAQARRFYRINLDGSTSLLGGGAGSLITAMEFDSSGALWAIEFLTGQFGTIDKTTGALDVLGTTLAGFQALDFDESGTMFAMNTNTDSLYTIDPSTGNTTLIGPSAGTFVKGISFLETDTAVVPEPGSWLLMSLGALGLMARRRRSSSLTVPPQRRRICQ
jgi:hypothetical protein